MRGALSRQELLSLGRCMQPKRPTFLSSEIHTALRELHARDLMGAITHCPTCRGLRSFCRSGTRFPAVNELRCLS